MTEEKDSNQYQGSQNLRARQGLHARYANKDWFGWVADKLRLPSNIDVLDIGCGAGWFWSSAAIKASQLRLTLADSSTSMVAEAVKNANDARAFSDVTGQVADAAALPFADQSFDVVTAMHMLYHVPDQEKALNEFARILKPGGTVAATTNGTDNMRAFFDLRRDVFGVSDTDPAAAAFSVEAATSLFKRHFDSVTIHMFEDTYAIEDPEVVFDYLVSFPPGSNTSERQRANAHKLIAARFDETDGVLNVKRESALICGR